MNVDINKYYREAAVSFYRIKQFNTHIRTSILSAPTSFSSEDIKYMNDCIHAMITGQCRSISNRLTKKIVNFRGFDYHTAAMCHKASDRQSKSNKEHCVPVSKIHDWILGISTPYDVKGLVCRDENDIYIFLVQNFVIAHVTPEEHSKLKPHQMPPDWLWTNPDKMGRYDLAEPKIEYFPFGERICPHCGLDPV